MHIHCIIIGFATFLSSRHKLVWWEDLEVQISSHCVTIEDLIIVIQWSWGWGVEGGGRYMSVSCLKYIVHVHYMWLFPVLHDCNIWNTCTDDDDAVGLAIAGRRGPCETSPRRAFLGQSIGHTNSTASGCDFIDPSHWRPAAAPSALHSAKHDVLLQTRMSADMAKVRQFAAQDELEDDRLADAHLPIHCFVGYVVLPQNPKHTTVAPHFNRSQASFLHVLHVANH